MSPRDIWQSAPPPGLSPEQTQRLKKAFDLFDTNKRGTISLAAFRELLRAIDADATDTDDPTATHMLHKLVERHKGPRPPGPSSGAMKLKGILNPAPAVPSPRLIGSPQPGQGLPTTTPAHDPMDLLGGFTAPPPVSALPPTAAMATSPPPAAGGGGGGENRPVSRSPSPPGDGWGLDALDDLLGGPSPTTNGPMAPSPTSPPPLVSSPSSAAPLPAPTPAPLTNGPAMASRFDALSNLGAVDVGHSAKDKDKDRDSRERERHGEREREREGVLTEADLRIELSFEEVREALGEESLYAIQRGRFFVVLALDEAETVRAAMHVRQVGTQKGRWDQEHVCLPLVVSGSARPVGCSRCPLSDCSPQPALPLRSPRRLPPLLRHGRWQRSPRGAIAVQGAEGGILPAGERPQLLSLPQQRAALL